MAYVAGPHTVIGNDVVDWVNDNEITGIAADDLALEVLPNPVPENTLSVSSRQLATGPRRLYRGDLVARRAYRRLRW